MLSEHERRVLRELELNLSSMATDAWPRRVGRAARLPIAIAGLISVLCLAGVAALPLGVTLTLTVVLSMMTGWLLRQKMARQVGFSGPGFFEAG